MYLVMEMFFGLVIGIVEPESGEVDFCGVELCRLNKHMSSLGIIHTDAHMSMNMELHEQQIYVR